MSLKGEIRTANDSKSASPAPLSELPRCDRLRNLPVRRKTADRLPRHRTRCRRGAKSASCGAGCSGIASALRVMRVRCVAGRHGCRAGAATPRRWRQPTRIHDGLIGHEEDSNLKDFVCLSLAIAISDLRAFRQ